MEMIGFDGKEQFLPAAEAICKAHMAHSGMLSDLLKSRLKKLKCSITTAARLLQDRLCENKGLNANYRPAMITLTYRNKEDWQADHISKFLTNCRNWLGRRGHKFHYVWVAELQERGAVHYHIIVWLPRGKQGFQRLPKPDKSGWWSFGSSQIVWAHKPVGYLTKYASKGNDLTGDDMKKFPKGLRLYGTGGLTKIERVEMRWWRAPKYVRDLLKDMVDVKKVRNGYHCDDGFVLSPWKFATFLGFTPFFIKVRENAQFHPYHF